MGELHEPKAGRVDPGTQAGFVKRGCSADDANASESLRYSQRAGGSIWATAGVPQDGEVGEREPVCERNNIGGPVPYPPAGLEIRAAETRPIWDNHADVEPVCQRLTTKQTPFEPAAGRAVEIKDWSSVRGAIFVISE